MIQHLFLIQLLLLYGWTSPQTVSPFAQYQDIYFNKTIKIIPPEASCSKGTIRLPEYITGSSEDLEFICSKNISCTTSSDAKLIYTTTMLGSIFTGQDGCTFPFPADDIPLTGRQRRFCFTDMGAAVSAVPAETYLVKFKLDNETARGTLLDFSNVRLDVENGKLIFRAQFSRINAEFSLNSGWNQIAIQMNYSLGYREYYNIFQEGELKAIIPVTTASLQQGATENVGPIFGSFRTFRVGLPRSVGLQFGQCRIMENVVCRNSKASSFYTLPNRYTSDEEENEQMFQRSLEASLKICPNSDKALLEYYLCSLYFPQCNGDGMLIEPCPDFCDVVTVMCPTLRDVPPFKCASLNVTRTCTGRNRPGGPNLLKAEVASIEKYERILVDQEIYRRHRGRLPEVSRPECLCPQQAPHLAGSQCYDNGFRNCQPNCRSYFPRVPFVIVSGNQQQQQTLVFSGDSMAEYIIDEKNRLSANELVSGNIGAWFSTPGTENFKVEIVLKSEFLIGDVDIYLLKPMPSKSLTIEFRRNKEWNVIHHFANRCEDLGFPPFVIAERPGVVSCTPYKMAGVEGAGFTNSYMLSWSLSNYSYGFGDYYGHGDLRMFDFYQSDAVRVTFDGHPLGNFTNGENYHAVTEIEIKRSTIRNIDCNCYWYGIQAGAECHDDVKCPPCKKGLNRDLAGEQCLPYIDKLYPIYGPMIGGTPIVIIGGEFGAGLRVTIDSIECDIIANASNTTHVACLTKPLQNVKLLGKPLVIRVVTSQFQINYRYPFVYKPDPIILDIFPRKSITRGGILQTVTGENLDSVARPQLIVYMKDVNRPEVVPLGPHVCYVRNRTLMECPAAVIPLPSSHNNLQKRSIDDTTYIESNVGSEGNSADQTRQKRAIKTWINDHVIDWYMGLLLDGVKEYVNLSANQNLQDKSQLLIFSSPKIYDFDPEVQVFKIHKGQNNIALKGEKLMNGVQEDDYHITIGNGACMVEDLAQNLIRCLPPSDDVPSAKDSDVHPDSGGLRVIARIGEWYRFSVGFLKYEVTLWDNPSFKGGIIALIVLILLILLLAYPIYKLIEHRRQKRKQQKASQLGHTVSYRREENDYETRKDLLDRIDPTLKMKIKPCLIDADNLQCKHEIGKGNFGVVYIGELKSEGEVYKVAVKTIKEQDATLTMISEFLGEASVMKEFNHKNVLSLIGIVIQGLDVYVILPFMENGSLKHFVQDTNNTFTVLDLVHLSSQACEGMVYLEAQKFVHRDLAARNCMVDELRNVKIADFGLARDIYETEYYRPEDRQRPLPYKWMAIECVVLDAKKFTIKSDVWSFGVLLWEVMTRGRTPYSEIPADQFGRFLRSNGRLEKPPHCPDPVYDVMMACWRAKPEDRPHFSDLMEMFEGMLSPYFSKEELKGAGYTRLSTMARKDVQSSDMYDTAHYAPDYLQLIDTPTIDDLLLPEQPSAPPHPLPPSDFSTDAPSSPPPMPPGKSLGKPAVPKKPVNGSNKTVPRQTLDDYLVAADANPYDNNYLHATKRP